MSDERWDRLEAVYGKGNRAAVLNQVAAWLLREKGAKLPPRAPLPSAAEPDDATG